MKNKKRKIATYLGLFCFSISLLMAELIYTRTARVSFGYTYQLLVISLALSGVGFGGIPAFFLFRWNDRGFDRWLVLLSLGYAVSLPAPFLTVIRLGSQVAFLGEQTTAVGWYFAAVFLVFFLAGAVIAAFLSHYSKRVSVIYALSLVGSAIGALAVVPMLDYFGGETVVVIVFAISLLSVVLFSYRDKSSRVLCLSVIVFGILSVSLLSFLAPHLRPGGLNTDAELTASNSFSQVDVYRISPSEVLQDSSRGDVGLSESPVKTYRILYDRLKKTYAFDYSRLSDMDYLSYDLTSLPYYLKKQPDVLILGAGGGIDVIRARLAGSKSITAVEINPLIVDIARDRLKTRAFDDAKVNLVIGEGRDYIAGSHKKYDLILLPVLGCPSDRGIDIRYNPENYLNTREAYETYLGHLKTGGILAVSNKAWIVQQFLSVGISALAEKKIEPKDKIAVINWAASSMLMIKPSGFTAADKRLINNNAAQSGFQVSFPAKSKWTDEDAKSITDDRPFLLEKDSAARIFSGGTSGAENTPQAGGKRGQEYLTLRFLTGIAVFGLLSTLVLLCVPPFFKTIRTGRRSLQVLCLLGYFACLGLGYITFQLVMVQKAFLLIGHPSYSVAVVLSSFLFFGGLGSLVTQRIDRRRLKVYVAAAALGLALFLTIYGILLNHIFVASLVSNLTVRVCILVVLLAWPCFLTGTLFPIGLEATDLIRTDLIPWMWGINGLAVVLGGALGALGSFFMGFRFVLIAASVWYLIAFLLFLIVKMKR